MDTDQRVYSMDSWVRRASLFPFYPAVEKANRLLLLSSHLGKDIILRPRTLTLTGLRTDTAVRECTQALLEKRQNTRMLGIVSFHFPVKKTTTSILAIIVPVWSIFGVIMHCMFILVIMWEGCCSLSLSLWWLLKDLSCYNSRHVCHMEKCLHHNECRIFCPWNYEPVVKGVTHAGDQIRGQPAIS